MEADSSIFEFLQAGSLDGIWYWDLDAVENEWMSPSFWTTLGYDPTEGKPVRMLGAHTDLTSQKRAEEALMKKTVELEEANRQLQEALDSIKTLRGLVPICTYCKKIQDDKGFWSQIETFVSQHSDAQFSHGICPDCVQEHFGSVLEDNPEKG